MRTSLLLAATCLVAFGLIAPVSAQNCGTDSFGYTCTDSNDPDGPQYDFKDISTSGIATGLGDDAGVTVPLSFSFPFYGVSKTSVGIASNGYLSFGTSLSDLSNDPIPAVATPNDLIAVLWDDLDPACAAPDPCEVYYEDRGDKFIVQYDSIPHFPDTSFEWTRFQVALEDDGDIRIMYELFTDDVSDPLSHTVGLENADATIGLQATFNGSGPLVVASGLAVCFDYPGSDPGCDKDAPPTCSLSFNSAVVTPTTVAAGGTVTFDVDVDNSGAGNKQVGLSIDYDRNGGPPSGSLSLISNQTVPPGGGAGSLRLRVPRNAPAGDYNVTLNLINEDTGEICDTANFVVTVTNPRVGAPTTDAPFEVISVDFGASAATGASAVAPNPFSGRTQISYAVEVASDVRLSVYDVLGREVAVLVDGQQEAGTHTATFDARGLAAGTYIYRLVVGNDVQTGRMTLAH
jgi:hypothetical protein